MHSERNKQTLLEIFQLGIFENINNIGASAGTPLLIAAQL